MIKGVDRHEHEDRRWGTCSSTQLQSCLVCSKWQCLMLSAATHSQLWQRTHKSHVAGAAGFREVTTCLRISAPSAVRIEGNKSIVKLHGVQLADSCNGTWRWLAYLVGRSPLLPGGAWLPAATCLLDGYERMGWYNLLHLQSSNPALAAAHSESRHLTVSCTRLSALLPIQSFQMVVLLPTADVSSSPSPACLPCSQLRTLTAAYRGKAIGEESMLQDIKLLKQLNFNAVRNAHYPNHMRWWARLRNAAHGKPQITCCSAPVSKWVLYVTNHGCHQWHVQQRFTCGS